MIIKVKKKNSKILKINYNELILYKLYSIKKILVIL